MLKQIGNTLWPELEYFKEWLKIVRKENNKYKKIGMIIVLNTLYKNSSKI